MEEQTIINKIDFKEGTIEYFIKRAKNTRDFSHEMNWREQ